MGLWQETETILLPKYKTQEGSEGGKEELDDWWDVMMKEREMLGFRKLGEISEHLHDSGHGRLGWE